MFLQQMKVVKQMYSELSEEQKKFIKDKHITMKKTPHQWLRLFRKIAAFDKTADQAKGWGCTIGIFIGLAFGGWFGASFFSPISEVAAGISVVLGLIFAGIAFYIYLNDSWVKSVDVKNQLRNFVVPLIGILQKEMATKGKLDLTLDLRDPVTPKNQGKTEGLPSPPSYYWLKATHYNHTWLTANTIFLDKTRVEWSIENHIQKREGKKRSASGKTKYKTKYKCKHMIELRVFFDKSHYSLKGTPKGGHTHLQEKPNGYLFKYRWKEKNSEINHNVSLERFLGMIAHAYQLVNPI